MLTKKDYEKASFVGVGMGLIIFGIIVFSITFVEWLLVSFGGTYLIAYPFFKAMSGLVILGIGYIILELELLRKN